MKDKPALDLITAQEAGTYLARRPWAIGFYGQIGSAGAGTPNQPDKEPPGVPAKG